MEATPPSVKQLESSFLASENLGHPLTDRLVRLSPNASDDEIMSASNATLKLGNQKNGWKDVCINHKHNLHETLCGVQAIGRRYCHIRRNSSNPNTTLFTIYEGGKDKRVNDQDIREAVKMAARQLDYEGTHGTPISLINTHLLRIGGACALALAGFDDTQICKMG